MLWIGTYRGQGGRGLYPLAALDPVTLGPPEEAIVNASFGLWSVRHRLAYFVDEQEQGGVGAWKREHGKWSRAGRCASGGALPCYLSLSQDGRWLAAANYGSGSVGLIRLDPETGSPERLESVFQGEGQGPDPERQDGPHAHCVVFAKDGTTLYHVDLGTDRVWRHTIGKRGFERTEIAFEAPPGIGPRHLAFVPGGEHALLLCELGARLLLLRSDGGRFACLDDVAMAPEACAGNLGGHLGLAADGTIHVTNRGHDSLVRFAIEDDRLVRKAWWPTGGSSSRHFILDGDAGLVAHEEGGGVTRIDRHGVVSSRADLPAAAFLIDIPD